MIIKISLLLLVVNLATQTELKASASLGALRDLELDLIKPLV